MEGVYHVVSSHESVLLLVKEQGQREDVRVRVAQRIARLSDVSPMADLLSIKVLKKKWKVSRLDELRALVTLHRRLTNSDVHLKELIRATNPRHLRFELIEIEAEKLDKVGRRLEVEGRKAVRRVGSQLRRLSLKLKAPRTRKSSWSKMRSKVLGAKDHVMEILGGPVDL